MADLLSKITLGNVTYDLKDAAARSNIATLLGEHALAALQNAAWSDVTATVSSNTGTALPTEAAVKNYVDAQVGAIHNFDIVIDQSGTAAGPSVAASADTMYKIYMVPDAAASAGTYVEWITIRSGVEGSYTYSWEKIGSTKADLQGYVTITTEIAGVQINDGINKATLQAALDLDSMAYANAASGNVASQTISGLSASGTPTGNVTINDLTQTPTAASLTKSNFTPAGTVSVTLANTSVLASVATAGTLPTMGEDVFVKPTFVEGNFSAGTLPSKAADTFDAGSLPTKAADTFSAGTLPSLGDATTAIFAQEGIVATVNTASETLIFSAAATNNAVTAQGTFSTGSLPSFTEGAFTQGTLPTFTEGAFNAGTLPSKAADTFTAGSFTQGEFTQGAMPTFTTGTVGVQSATFAGTEAENVLVTGVTYNVATANGASFAGDAATYAVDDIVVSEKTVTVTPVTE